MVSAFVGGSAQRLSSRAPARGRSAVCGLRMSDDAAGVVAEKYPIYVKNKGKLVIDGGRLSLRLHPFPAWRAIAFAFNHSEGSGR